MYPIIFSTDLFGLLSKPLSLHTYGLLIATGFILAVVLAKRQAEREGEDPELVTDMAFWLLLFGLLGARFVFILTKLDQYIRNPIEILMFWRGGLVFYGAFIGAALCMAYYSRRHRMNFFKFADFMIPFLAMAHTFGRFGCLAAGCCYGKVTDLGWGIVFPSGSMAHNAHQQMGLVGLGDAAMRIHPTQLYEGGAELVMFFILVGMRPLKRFHGQIFLIWLACYPLLRSVIEMFRGDKERGVFMMGISTSQFISIGVALSAIVLYIYLRRLGGGEQSRAA